MRGVGKIAVIIFVILIGVVLIITNATVSKINERVIRLERENHDIMNEYNIQFEKLQSMTVTVDGYMNIIEKLEEKIYKHEAVMSIFFETRQ